MYTPYCEYSDFISGGLQIRADPASAAPVHVAAALCALPWATEEDRCDASQATRAGQPRVAYPTTKRILLHIFGAINLETLLESHGIL